MPVGQQKWAIPNLPSWASTPSPRVVGLGSIRLHMAFGEQCFHSSANLGGDLASFTTGQAGTPAAEDGMRSDLPDGYPAFFQSYSLRSQ